MDKAIKNNILINKYTRNTIKSGLNNNYKILIPEVNLLINSGKKILFFTYEVAGLILLKVIGMIFYLVFKWF